MVGGGVKSFSCQTQLLSLKSSLGLIYSALLKNEKEAGEQLCKAQGKI